MLNVLVMTTIILIMYTSLLFLTKPKLFFDKKGNIKPFGFQFDEYETPITLTIFSYGIMVTIYLFMRRFINL